MDDELFQRDFVLYMPKLITIIGDLEMSESLCGKNPTYKSFYEQTPAVLKNVYQETCHNIQYTKSLSHVKSAIFIFCLIMCSFGLWLIVYVPYKLYQKIKKEQELEVFLQSEELNKYMLEYMERYTNNQLQSEFSINSLNMPPIIK